MYDASVIKAGAIFLYIIDDSIIKIKRLGEGNYSEKIERMVSRGNLSPYAQRGKEKCNI